MYLISPGVSGCGVERRRDNGGARRVWLAGSAIVLMAVALFAVGSRRVEAAGAAGQSSSDVSAASLANYPLVVHVSGSYWDMHDGLNTIDATIDSAKYKLVTVNTPQLIALGDYHARIVPPKKTPAYIVDREYEFLFPDGKTAKFQLCGEWEQ